MTKEPSGEKVQLANRDRALIGGTGGGLLGALVTFGLSLQGSISDNAKTNAVQDNQIRAIERDLDRITPKVEQTAEDVSAIRSIVERRD